MVRRLTLQDRPASHKERHYQRKVRRPHIDKQPQLPGAFFPVTFRMPSSPSGSSGPEVAGKGDVKGRHQRVGQRGCRLYQPPPPPR